MFKNKIKKRLSTTVEFDNINVDGLNLTKIVRKERLENKMEYKRFYRLDKWDGGERTVPTNIYFVNREEADRYKAKQPHDDLVPVDIMLYYSADEYEKDCGVKAIKQAALAKLTPLEKMVLGLDPEK